MTTSTSATPNPLAGRFQSEANGLAAAGATETVDLPEGATFDLEITSVRKRLGDATVRMLAYNGSVPGPTLRVRQGSTVTVNVTNNGDLDTTVHWHGLRLDNRNDGTHLTQPLIPVGGAFAYELQFSRKEP